MKEFNKRNTAVAKTQRDKMMRTRHNQKSQVNSEAEQFFPKNLAKVESIIKNRVEIDKEIGRRRKMRNQNMDKEPQIYVTTKPRERTTSHERRR